MTITIDLLLPSLPVHLWAELPVDCEDCATSLWSAADGVDREHLGEPLVCPECGRVYCVAKDRRGGFCAAARLERNGSAAALDEASLAALRERVAEVSP